jgi:uncharacterized membrane protein
MRTSPEAVAIFLHVSTTPQNVAIVMVFLVLGGVVALTVAPFEVGTIRLAGVSLLWWYGAVAAPVVAVTVTVAALLWTSRKSIELAGSRADARPLGAATSADSE